MGASKLILLACGSFNPPTNMHLRMFELARDHLHRLGFETIGGIVSPVHDGYGKKDLAASTHRIAMLKYALEDSDWIKVSEWECQQENWTQTRKCLQYHQNHINAIINDTPKSDCNHINEDDVDWIPNDVRNNQCGHVKVKLLCGADLLESFGTPGLWADDDIEAIVGQHGLIVVTRQDTDPLKFIYNSDVLTKYMGNIIIVTEWIANEVSSTKIRRALRRSESVRYLIPDKVLQYIHKYNLYGAKNIKYLFPSTNNSVFLTPSPSDVIMDSPSPTNNRCLIICDKEMFTGHRMSIDTVDAPAALIKSNNSLINAPKKHPGQAMKVITTSPGQHKVVKAESIKKEVCRNSSKVGEKKVTINDDKIIMINDDKKITIKDDKINTIKDEKKSDDKKLKTNDERKTFEDDRTVPAVKPKQTKIENFTNVEKISKAEATLKEQTKIAKLSALEKLSAMDKFSLANKKSLSTNAENRKLSLVETKINIPLDKKFPNPSEFSKRKSLKTSKSCADFDKIEKNPSLGSSKSNANLQNSKNCDENLIKFIFTKHGIQVISDVETIV